MQTYQAQRTCGNETCRLIQSASDDWKGNAITTKEETPASIWAQRGSWVEIWVCSTCSNSIHCYAVGDYCPYCGSKISAFYLADGEQYNPEAPIPDDPEPTAEKRAEWEADERAEEAELEREKAALKQRVAALAARGGTTRNE